MHRQDILDKNNKNVYNDPKLEKESDSSEEEPEPESTNNKQQFRGHMHPHELLWEQTNIMKVDVPRILERIFNSRYYEIDVTDLPLVDLAKAPFMVKVQDGKARFLVFAYDECEAYSRVFSFIEGNGYYEYDDDEEDEWFWVCLCR